jgi:hypothetical protein
MCVVTQKRTFVKLDELGDMDYGKATHYIKHEGIYLFGGVCGKGASEQSLNNDTYFFPVGPGVNKKWKVLETKG